MQKNTDQKNYIFRHFLRSVGYYFTDTVMA